jgi:hypothetical protein
VKCYRWREADNTGIFYSRTISFIHFDIPFDSYSTPNNVGAAEGCDLLMLMMLKPLKIKIKKSQAAPAPTQARCL